MSAKKLDLDELRSLLGYEPLTGKFTWAVRRQGVKLGAVAGCIDRHGYRIIKVGQRDYLAHRLAWLYVHGVWPADHIDHIDGDPGNNAIANLREATPSENQRNRGANKNNTSGFKGVSWNKAEQAWIAQIGSDRRSIYLGAFSCPAEAHRAYVEASHRHHGEFGRVK